LTSLEGTEFAGTSLATLQYTFEREIDTQLDMIKSALEDTNQLLLIVMTAMQRFYENGSNFQQAQAHPLIRLRSLAQIMQE
jgi:hypothetical protein